MKNRLFILMTVFLGGLSPVSYANLDDAQSSKIENDEEKFYPGNSDGYLGSIQDVIEDKKEDEQDNEDTVHHKKLQMHSAEKFRGTVESVTREPYPDGRLFIQIVLNTEEGSKTILVGPANYVDQSKVKIQIGDKIIVNGFRIGANGEEVIVAKDIDKNGNLLKLLDDNRSPYWDKDRNKNN
ncbi:MAG: hypothetical protein R3E91_00650 [Chlamydiales bacterium]